MHNNYRFAICYTCWKSFSSQQARDQHMIEAHSKPSTRVPNLGVGKTISTRYSWFGARPQPYPLSSTTSSLQRARGLARPNSTRNETLSYLSELRSVPAELAPLVIKSVRATPIVLRPVGSSPFITTGASSNVSGMRQGRSTNAVLPGTGKRICVTCGGQFESLMAADQHVNTMGDHVHRPLTRERFLNCFLHRAQLEREDRKQSVSEFRNVMTSIMNYVRTQHGGHVYSPNFRLAGSMAVKVKIGKADEFDTNIPLEVHIMRVLTACYIQYTYRDQAEESGGINLNRIPTPKVSGLKMIPDGSAVVKVNLLRTPHYLLQGDHLIPVLCQKHFYDRVKAAIQALNMKNVHLSNIAHGPAITLTIVPSKGHHINVDLTLSLTCDLKVSAYGWPRPSTWQALKIHKIAACRNAPIHLVPKGVDTWSISFSKVEETLLNGIDSGNECRRQVMQIMKRYMQIFKSKYDAEGMSSHIIKHQLLWTVEKRTGNGYWHQTNMDTCVVDVMTDFIDSLKQERLPNYFRSSENILLGKRRDVIDTVARYFGEERSKLLEMG